MKPLSAQQQIKILGITSVVLFSLCVGLGWSNATLKTQAKSAREQIVMLNEMSNRALVDNPAQLADRLRAVMTYYPSGTKQDKGSALDQIVEQQRDRVVQEIITMLRVRTRDDLGRAPEPWIKKYGKVGK